MRSEQIETSHLELQNSGQFTSEHPYKALAKSAPLLISRGVLIALLQYFAKRAIMAQKSESILAEYAVISVIEIFTPYTGLHIISTKVSHLHQEEIKAAQDSSGEIVFDPAKIGELYQQGVLFGFFMLLPTAGLCFGAPTLLRLAGQSETVVRHSAPYFSYVFFAYISDTLYRSLARIPIGLSQSHIALVADTVEGMLDVIFTYLLLNGKCGLPPMGVEGVALAYFIAATITAGGNALYLHCRSDFKKYQLFDFNFKKALLSPEFKSVIKSGLHLSLSSFVVYTTQIVTTFLSGLSSDAALVGLQAGGSYGVFVSLPIHGFSEAANVVLGKLFKSDLSLFRTVGNVTFGICFLYALLCYAALIVMIDPITKIFIDPARSGQNDFQMVKTFLYIQGGMEVVSSFSNMGSDVLSACLETRIPFMLSVGFVFLFNLILSVAVYILSDHNPVAMFSAQLLGLFFDSLGILLCWYHKKNILHDEKSEANLELPRIVSSPHLFLRAKEKEEEPRHCEVVMALPSLSR